MGCVLGRHTINSNLVSHHIINEGGLIEDEWPNYTFEGFTRSCYCDKSCPHGNTINDNLGLTCCNDDVIKSGCQSVRMRQSKLSRQIVPNRRHSFGPSARVFLSLIND